MPRIRFTLPGWRAKCLCPGTQQTIAKAYNALLQGAPDRCCVNPRYLGKGTRAENVRDERDTKANGVDFRLIWFLLQYRSGHRSATNPLLAFVERAFRNLSTSASGAIKKDRQNRVINQGHFGCCGSRECLSLFSERPMAGVVGDPEFRVSSSHFPNRQPIWGSSWGEVGGRSGQFGSQPAASKLPT